MAKNLIDPYAILLCALYSYGNAKKIVEFLQSIDFTILDKSENEIRNKLQHHYYRFQSNDDVIESFIIISKLKKEYQLEDIFYEGYSKKLSILDGIDHFIATINKYIKKETKGLKFLFSNPIKRDKNHIILYKQNGPYKRYNMFLRWMVRDDNLDLGYFRSINKRDLILPLDTHTFQISKKLKLLKRDKYDLQAAIEITNNLKSLDPNDPIKYDFALYRIGQENIF